MFNSKRQQPKRGIILLVVLGMLSLFSVLVVSFVVFSSQMADRSYAASQRELTEIKSEPILENGLVSLIVGTNDPKSAFFGHSLMEDLWGVDGLGLRVAHHRTPPATGGPGTTVPTGGQGLLLRPLSGQRPQTTLFKFPTNRARWHYDGSSPPGGPPLSNVPTSVQDELDDVFAGRIVTFVEGPLYGVSFRIIRSFGRVNAGSQEELAVAANLVIDLSEMPTEEVSIDGETLPLYVVAGNTPNALLYDAGPDGQPGTPGDDDGMNGANDIGEYGAPLSDDIGYRFIINGTPFNGLGQNPTGLTGVMRGTNVIDTYGHIELQPNARLIGTQAAGGNGSGSAFPEPDEPWDAADMENIWLAWLPSDHRRAAAAFDASPQIRVYGGVDANELNRQLGQHIIPSFHRPAVINYLMNAPIRLPGDELDPANTGYIERRFVDLSGDFSSPNQDHLRMQVLLKQLRRAVMRPLNFDHLFINAGESDMNADADAFDGAPAFSGSNMAPILNETILAGPAQFSSTGQFLALRDQVFRLASWLINGPWDVDNDNDGIPDSVWVDLNMPPVQAADGRWIKPLYAVLVEDLDGKINVNAAGSYNQMLTQNFPREDFPAGPITAVTDEASFFKAKRALDVFVRGGGIGPAEIHFGHLFDYANGEQFGVRPSGGASQVPYHVSQISLPGQVLLSRYGNLLNTRYGGEIFYYRGNLSDSLTKFPGAGDYSMLGRTLETDLLSRIPFPSRLDFHTVGSPQGEPVDIAGRGFNVVDRYGNRGVLGLDSSRNPKWLNEQNNTPYESGIEGLNGDDKHFTPAEYDDFVKGGELAGRLSELLGDAADDNEALRRILTTESRSLDSPEVVGEHGLIQLIASKLNVGAGSKQVHLDRMLAVEMRKGSKLNLNRPVGNGADDNSNSYWDENSETKPLFPVPTVPNQPNNHTSGERAFPKIQPEYPTQSNVLARYGATIINGNDFNGFDTNNDGILDQGTDFDGDGFPDKAATGNELLARHLYCLMYCLIADPTNPVFVEHFPYPTNFTADANTRNNFVARRIAQWAANAVDCRDTDVACTRLRYDPNPFDGFSLAVAQTTVVWGMERPEVEITETGAVHDKRLRRNLTKEMDPNDPTLTLDGELPDDEDPDDMDMDPPDSDMDQFRIPEASAWVELHSLRSRVRGTGLSQVGYPGELYSFSGGLPRLDLGRTVGAGNLISPVFRLAIGQPTAGNRGRSTRWVFDAERIGRDLVATGGRAEELDYLTNPGIDYTSAADVNAEVDSWIQAVRHSAEVRHSLSNNGEFVTIGDDDFDPRNDGGSEYRIRLERFVWFTREADLVPAATLNVISNASSGMRLGNVFYNKNNLENGYNDPAHPDNVAPTLAPGQYAVIAPRAETRFGQTTMSTEALGFPYDPVDHRLEFVKQAGGIAPQIRCNLFDFANTRRTPRYAEDSTTSGNGNFHVDSVVPIICQSLYPHQVDPGRGDWATHFGLGGGEIVDMGFNISAPESGGNYYQAPEHRIADTAGRYPKVDGYRDYENDLGFHPDTPLDHEVGTPMEDNRWNAVGTHQEARTVFLQRLADPTEPWHPIDNPYITLDFAPIDLTTINGEHDVRQQIDRDGDGNATEMVDNRTQWDPGSGDFDPKLKFDSRRKIPDVKRDRGASALLSIRGPDGSGNLQDPGDTLGNYARLPIAERSAMSATYSVLREVGESAGADGFWKFSFGSMWNDGNVDAIASSLNTTYAFNRTFDAAASPFRQSFGFLNREYGNPIRSDTGQAWSLELGTPEQVLLSAVPWLDREFQSPMDLMNIPAVSRTGLLPTFSPGTTLENNGTRERPTHFDHLLGFNAKFSEYRAADEAGGVEATPYTNNLDNLTGERAGFEQILDYVDIGPVWFDSQRWFEPSQVSFLRQVDPATPLTLPERIFNRSVETLQPPFNYIGRHRTPGKVNLNTTGDYIRRGQQYYAAFPYPPPPSDPTTDPAHPDRFLDVGENPRIMTSVGSGRVASEAQNSSVNGDGLTQTFRNSAIYGNGSVHRALTWSISTAYEMDLTFGSPSVMGQNNGYEQTVDTNFGRSFKAFIESRRGYATSYGWNLFKNPRLHFLYPTRFAGVFAPAQAAAIPSVQRFMRTESESAVRVLRRTHDMSLLRAHPDLNVRTMTGTDRNDALSGAMNAFSLGVEDDTGISAPVPGLTASSPEVENLRIPVVNTGLFERSQAELHKDFRFSDRDSFFRHKNAAKLANLTTHHSNVFMVRMTVGYFVVDPITGAIGTEFLTDTGSNLRTQGTYIIDRSIPIGFLRGVDVNAMNTVIYSSVD